MRMLFNMCKFLLKPVYVYKVKYENSGFKNKRFCVFFGKNI